MIVFGRAASVVGTRDGGGARDGAGISALWVWMRVVHSIVLTVSKLGRQCSGVVDQKYRALCL